MLEVKCKFNNPNHIKRIQFELGVGCEDTERTNSNG